MKIGLYIGSWTPNIGNAFFDYGLKAVLKTIFPDAQFFLTGGAVHWMFRYSINEIYKNKHKNKFLSKLKNMLSYKEDILSYSDNSLEIGEIADLDILAFAGMSMCQEFVETNGKTFINAAKNGTAILGIGTGMQNYSDREADIFSDFLESAGRYAILTRDEVTFSKFNKRIKNIESGIDCAFFLPEYYMPPKLNYSPFDIINFDTETTIPQIVHTVDNIIYTHHTCWGPLKASYMEKPNTLISDIPEDYLALYSNVHETHSDRVHACIATLAYGNRAKLYSQTQRKSLFDKFDIDITREIGMLNLQLLNKLKHEQVEKIKILVSKIPPPPPPDKNF
jgi:hypothetical protein